MLAIALLIAPDTSVWDRLASDQFPGERIFGAAGLIALLLAIACFPSITRRLRLRNISLPQVDRRALARPLCIGLIEAGAAIFAFYVLLPVDLSRGLRRSPR